jgi:two-component system alkaline phosphatase synthesis response regulator PhoP
MPDYLLCIPEEIPREIVASLNLLGVAYKLAPHPSVVEEMEGVTWRGALLVVESNPRELLSYCTQLKEKHPEVGAVLVAAKPEFLVELAAFMGSFDDFCLLTAPPMELGLRISKLSGAANARPSSLIEVGALRIDMETYQVTVGSHPVDLTYMEYKLLAFLASKPGRVFSRETLLQRVWGYDYYGGTRTVDVHIRRLRAKLGQEYGSLIETIRSVGYRFRKVRA